MKYSLVPRLALERCRVHLAQISALVHLDEKDEFDGLSEEDRAILHLVQQIDKDLSFIYKD